MVYCVGISLSIHCRWFVNEMQLFSDYYDGLMGENALRFFSEFLSGMLRSVDP